MSTDSQHVDVTKNYYDSEDADNFYYHIWGGEDIHIGLYQGENDDDITTASRKTVQTMAEMVPNLGADTKVLDIGAGYGGAGRQLAKAYGCHVTTQNLSEAENERNRQKNKEQGLEDKIEVVGGNFEELPFKDNSFDLVWTMDAILHSDRKEKVFEEADRVLKPGGYFILTDPMQADDAPLEKLGPVLARIHLDSMGSMKEYRSYAQKFGWEEVEVKPMPHQLKNHYSAVRRLLNSRMDELKKHCSEEYLTNMNKGLGHWVEAATNGYLNWGIMLFRKKS